MYDVIVGFNPTISPRRLLLPGISFNVSLSDLIRDVCEANSVNNLLQQIPVSLHGNDKGTQLRE